MSKLDEKALRAVERFNMLDEKTVIAAVSGGADSVAMLHFLAKKSDTFGYKLYAAHLNHMLRGDEADRDEYFVRDLCEKLDVQLFTRHRDIHALAEQNKLSTELCGRNERYAFFSELSERLSAKIATAHTASDNAETIIFNMTRGSGLKGLSGIAPVRENIIRPLILVTREEVEEYCRGNNLSFVTDSSNLTDDYSRNILRHNVVPVLRELNPSLENTLSNQSELLRSYNSYLELKTVETTNILRTENGYDCRRLSELPDALRFSVLRDILKNSEAETDFRTVSLLSDTLSGGALDLGNNLRAVCKQGTLRIIKTDCTDNNFSEKELKINSEFIYNRKHYSVLEINNDAESLDYSVLELKPVFRTRRAGDRFTLPRRKVTKSLKKYFNELKIPEENRNSVLVLAKDSEVLWIEGIGASENARLRGSRGLKILIENERGN